MTKRVIKERNRPKHKILLSQCLQTCRKCIDQSFLGLIFNNKKEQQHRRKEMESGNIIGIDPAARNLGFCVLSTTENRIVSMAHVDLAGKKAKAPTASKCKELIRSTLENAPFLRKNIRKAIIEDQSHINNNNVAIQNELERIYISLGVEVEIIRPQEVIRHIMPVIDHFPQCVALKKELERIQSRIKRLRKDKTKAVELKRERQRCYNKKKTLFENFGKHLMSPTERNMISVVSRKRKELREAMIKHDKQYRPNKKTKRTIKTKAVDIVEGFLTALVAMNKHNEKDDRDYITERIERSLSVTIPGLFFNK